MSQKAMRFCKDLYLTMCAKNISVFQKPHIFIMIYIGRYVQSIDKFCNTPDIFNDLCFTIWTNYGEVFQKARYFYIDLYFAVCTKHKCCKRPNVFLMTYIWSYLQSIVKDWKRTDVRCCFSNDLYLTIFKRHR